MPIRWVSVQFPRPLECVVSRLPALLRANPILGPASGLAPTRVRAAATFFADLIVIPAGLLAGWVGYQLDRSGIRPEFHSVRIGSMFHQRRGADIETNHQKNDP